MCFSSFLIFIQSEVIISCAVKSIYYRLSRTDCDQTRKGISITWRLIDSGIFFLFGEEVVLGENMKATYLI